MSKIVSPWIAAFLLKLGKNERAEKKGERFQKLADSARSVTQQISVEQLLSDSSGERLIIDVRETIEFVRGHIPHAIHLSRGILELEIERVAPAIDRQIVAYCGHGNRSSLAAESLQRMGYTQVKVIKGGFRAWLDAGFPAWRSESSLED